jgi:cytochrome c
MYTKMMMALAVLASLAIAAPVWAQNAPPPSEEAKRIETLVNKAAALVEKQGKAAAFVQLRTRDSEWWSGNTYLFAYDQNLNVLLNPAFPKREGANVHGQTDANGKPMHDEFLKIVREKGAGWVDYVFPKPGENKPSQKWTYVKGVSFDGTPGLIGAGFYPK